MKHTWLLIFTFVFLLPGVNFAEIYQYRDEDGNLRFTDNYLEIPTEQRPVFSPPEDKIGVSQDETAEVPNPAMANPEKANIRQAQGDDISGQTDNNDFAENFRREQEALAAEYRILTAQQEQLEAQRESRKTSEEIARFNAEALALSDRIKVFNERQQKLDDQLRRYAELIKTYNDSISARNQPSSPSEDQ